ncbi:MAG: DUF1385 domain-containing protein [Ruminococcaceae bacterium]|nr:DUF1385 domain-containing protein [Oscillospiraceae bacterium]
MKEKKNCKLVSCRKTSIGGQALMEGIMMRGPQKSAMAVRRPNGEIFFEEEENTAKKRPAFCRWPLVRGVFGFIDSMRLGYKYLMRSAEIFCEEEAPLREKSEETPLTPQTGVENAVSATEESATEKAEQEPKSIFSGAAMTAMTVLATVLGVALALVLVFWLPAFIYQLLADHVLPDGARNSRMLRSVFEGLLKIVILVVYMALVSLMKDIRRTFMYHGAEHKTIFCYEKGLPLTVENVRKQRRFHPRCGTSFLILMLLVSIFVGLFIPAQFGTLTGMANTLVRAACKILLIPVMMGIGYELLKLAGKYDNWFTRVISAPGMWLQHITVREPDDGMIECAIMAFEAVMPEEDKTAYLALDDGPKSAI